MKAQFIAIGSAHWDILGHATQKMALHDDVGGKIQRLIGGVAGPIAMKLARAGAEVELICYAGQDEFGEALLKKLSEFNVKTQHIIRGQEPTDVYMGIEAQNGLIAAIADCHSLEKSSAQALKALNILSNEHNHLIIDGNLHEEALISLSKNHPPCQSMTLIPASPGKIMRFRHFLNENPGKIPKKIPKQIIVNLREASLLANQKFPDSHEAANALIKLGFISALVSNGGDRASFANQEATVSALPPKVNIKRFTGAGDTLCAHFLYAQSQKFPPQKALEHALQKTSEFISEENLDA